MAFRLSLHFLIPFQLSSEPDRTREGGIGYLVVADGARQGRCCISDPRVGPHIANGGYG